MNRERTPLPACRQAGRFVRAVRTRRDFYDFALFSGFRTNLDRHYQPAEGDQILFCWSTAHDGENRLKTTSVVVQFSEVIFKFGRPHLRLFSESGSRDSSLPRDFSFFGRMMRMTIGA